MSTRVSDDIQDFMNYAYYAIDILDRMVENNVVINDKDKQDIVEAKRIMKEIIDRRLRNIQLYYC